MWGQVISAGIGATSSLITNLINRKTAKEINDQNVSHQQQTNLQNEMLTRDQWSRDDNAVQRRVADLKAAGLSPILAAGSPAGTSSPISNVAPHVQGLPEWQSVALAGLQARQMQADYSQTRAQTAHLRMQDKIQMKHLDLENRKQDFQEKVLRHQMDGQIIRNKMDEFAYQYGLSNGVPHDRIHSYVNLFNSVEKLLQTKIGLDTEEIYGVMRDNVSDFNSLVSFWRRLQSKLPWRK